MNRLLRLLGAFEFQKGMVCHFYKRKRKIIPPSSLVGPIKNVSTIISSPDHLICLATTSLKCQIVPSVSETQHFSGIEVAPLFLS